MRRYSVAELDLPIRQALRSDASYRRI